MCAAGQLEQRPEDSRSDQELIGAANEGDAHAFESLYLRYRDWVVGAAHRITRDTDEALDVLQDVFLYLFKKFPGFELRAQMKTFLYPVVRNLALEKLRKRRRTVGLDGEVAEPAVEDMPAPPVNGNTLAAAVARLPDDEREIVALRFSDDMALAEIAEALGIPAGTVKSRLHRALRRLGDVLGKEGRQS
jgi:RNA polymerase sigma-70 factor (ECF subfamily)